VDPTVTFTTSNGGTSFGGGKLGMYTYWGNQSTWPDNTQQSNFEFEFYNYSSGNYGETGNDAFSSGVWVPGGTPAQFLASYNATMVQNELYHIPASLAGTGNAYQNAFADYMVYLSTCTAGASCPPPSGSPPTITGPSREEGNRISETY
jgi:hypothetical protein